MDVKDMRDPQRMWFPLIPVKNTAHIFNPARPKFLATRLLNHLSGIKTPI